MDGEPFSIKLALEAILEVMPFEELGIPKSKLADATQHLYAQLLRVGLDAYTAQSAGIPFWQAVEDGDGYRFLRLVHLGATDILQLSLPEELQQWLRRIFSGDFRPIAERLQNLIARLAITPTTPPVERALMAFFLYEGLRLNLAIAAWKEDGVLPEVGFRFAHIDRIAQEELDHLLELAAHLGPEDRPLSVLVAMGMVRVQRHAQGLATELRTIGDDISKAVRLREVFEARVEAYLREMDAPDAALIRNRIAPVLGEQRLPLDLLQAEHPLSLGGMTRCAMDQRVKRLLDGLEQTKALPPRRAPALIDLILEAEAPALPEAF